MTSGFSVSRRFLTWVASSLVSAAILGALGYLSVGVLESAERVPVIEERLNNHIQGINLRLERVEKGIDYLVRRESRRSGEPVDRVPLVRDTTSVEENNASQ